MKEANGVEFKIARIRAGYRQYEVAAQLGIHPCQLSEIESGRRKPSTEVLQQLLQILGLLKDSPVTDKRGKKVGIDREKPSAREEES